MVINVLNLEKVLKDFGDLSKIDIMPAIRKSARMVQKTAKELAPYDTGILAGSIKVRHYPSQQSSVVYTTTEYAPYQEFGTRKMKAHPFMNPAVNINRDAIQRLVVDYVRKQLRNPQAKTIDSDSGDQ